MVVFREQKPFFGRVLSSATTHLLLLHINGSLTSAGESSSGCQGAEEVTSSKNLNLYSSSCQAVGWSRECVGRGRATPFLPGSLNFSGSED